MKASTHRTRQVAWWPESSPHWPHLNWNLVANAVQQRDGRVDLPSVARRLSTLPRCLACDGLPRFGQERRRVNTHQVPNTRPMKV
ncbi:MAG: hypothetical protein QOH27_4617 [Mycobacterium sp.]|nr:hypothetical protein [Mycobacterium sp.]